MTLLNNKFERKILFVVYIAAVPNLWSIAGIFGTQKLQVSHVQDTLLPPIDGAFFSLNLLLSTCAFGNFHAFKCAKNTRFNLIEIIRTDGYFKNKLTIIL